MKIIKRILIACVTFSLLAVAVGCGTVTHSPSGTTTTIILTRHSDRDPMVDSLNEKGWLYW